MHIKITILFFCFLPLFTLAEVDSKNFTSFKTFSANGHLQAVIEIPAGTNKKIEFDYDTNEFKADIEYGQTRIIDFLSYPGNYGFIPSTVMSKEIGGDGDSLDILVLSQSIATGTVIEVNPIAVLNLIDGGEIDSKIIAVPINKNNRIITATSYEELESKYPNIKNIIEIWFTSYKGKGIVESDGWGNERVAIAEIEKWIQN
tara:strand:+ start:41 stop:646 length:606 start_codon:yes stop_codon:yes gene_type:complete